jgi:hypothetical protein
LVILHFEAVNPLRLNALVVSGSDLYAVGRFEHAGGSAASQIAKWNGSNWSALGSGMNADVFAVAVSGSDLYAGGLFTRAGGKASTYVAHAYLEQPNLSIFRSGVTPCFRGRRFTKLIACNKTRTSRTLTTGPLLTIP